MNAERRLDVVAFGDVNLDWVLDGPLGFRWADLVENGRTAFHNIEELPGGGGFNFAKFAQEAGWRTAVVGKVGDDLAGKHLATEVEGAGIKNLLRVAKGRRTGCCFIARDSADVRFLVNTADNANYDLQLEDLGDIRDVILSSRMIYVSGFCIRDPLHARYRAIRQMLEWVGTSESQPAVVFDVVPHRIYETYSWDQFRDITRQAQILISEVATMRRFLRLGDLSETITRTMAEETVQALKAHYKSMVLRFGRSGCDEEILWNDATKRLEHRRTGHSHANDKRGYGDRLAIRAIQEFFSLIGE